MKGDRKYAQKVAHVNEIIDNLSRDVDDDPTLDKLETMKARMK